MIIIYYCTADYYNRALSAHVNCWRVTNEYADLIFDGITKNNGRYAPIWDQSYIALFVVSNNFREANH